MQKKHAPKVRSAFKIVFFLIILCQFQSCGKALNLKLKHTVPVSDEFFVQAKGYKLTFELYAPSSMMGWELSPKTQLIYDDVNHTYSLDNIPIKGSFGDANGPRFKVCGDFWMHQFGFGDLLSESESTFGVPNEGVVVQVEQFTQAVNDLRLEFPKSSGDFMKIEFKVISQEPLPQGLIRITLH